MIDLSGCARQRRPPRRRPNQPVVELRRLPHLRQRPAGPGAARRRSSRSAPATGWRSSGRRGRASPRCSTSSAASTGRRPGTYLIDGIDARALTTTSARAARPEHRLRLPDLPPARPPHALENVMLADVYAGGDRAGPARARAGGARAGRAWATGATSCPTKLSGGEQQRVAIARALLGDRRGCCSATSRRATSTPSTPSRCWRCSTSSRDDGLTLVVITHDEDVAAHAEPRRADRGRRAHRGDGVIAAAFEPSGRSARACRVRAAPTREPRPALPEPRMELRDLVAEAAAGLMARPARVGLTVLGTVIGVAALVATLGLSKTAGNQIVGRFDAVAATDVVVTPGPARSGRRRRQNVIPWDAEARMKRLNGVAAAGTLAEVNVRGDARAVGADQRPARPDRGPASGEGRVARAVARGAGASSSPGGFPTPGTRRAATAWPCWASTRPAGSGSRTWTSSPRSSSATGCTQVIGLVGGVGRQASLLGSLTIPNGTARREFGVAAPSSVQIETDIGAVELIVRQAPRGAQPHRPEAAAGGRAAGPRAAARRRRERPQRPVPAARRRVAARGRARHRERDPRVGARAGGRDRPAAGAGRGAPAHRRAVPDREHRDGPAGRDHRHEPRHAGRGRRWPPAAPGRRCWTRGCRWPRRSWGR